MSAIEFMPRRTTGAYDRAAMARRAMGWRYDEIEELEELEDYLSHEIDRLCDELMDDDDPLNAEIDALQLDLDETRQRIYELNAQIIEIGMAY